MIKRKSMGLMAVVFFILFGLLPEGSAQNYGGTLRLGMYSDINTPDLHRVVGNPTAQMALLVAEAVVDWDEECNLVPGLAESIKISADATEYTFFLRKGILFHNGRELTAEDVKKNIEHFQDEKTRSPRRGEFMGIRRVEVIDKYTVKIFLKEPDVALLVALRPTSGYMIAPESFESKPPHPIGTGPFEFVEWRPRQFIKLRKFKNYWKKDKNGNALPYVDEVILRPINDDTVRFTALRTGDVDWVWTVPFELIPELKRKPPAGIGLSVRGGVRWIHFQLNHGRGPTKDPRVRQAFAYAIDKNSIMNGLTWGLASPEGQLYPPGSQWYFEGVKDPYAQPDLVRARELLREAGYEKGVQLSAIVHNETFIMNLSTLAQANLKKAGIDLKLEVMDRASHSAMQNNHQFDVNPTHLAFEPDPDGTYARFFHTGADQNYPLYNNPEYDKLMEEAGRIPDTAKRKEMYRNGLEILNRDLPVVFLGHYPVAQASRSYLKNMRTNSRGDIRWVNGGAPHAWLEK